MTPVIELKEVSFCYGPRSVVELVSLKVEKGDFLAIMGPNGSGKTTLVKLALGLLKPLTGSISLFGTDLNEFKQWHRVGYVSQKATGFDARFPATVEEVVAAGRFGRLGPGHRPGREDRRAVEEALELVEMKERKGSLIGNLSGGQQQRVFIARALAARPELLVLDEPVVGLDSRALDTFYALLGRLNKELGITLVTVSHDTGAVGRQVNKVACINRTLVFHGSPDEALSEHNLARLYGLPVHKVAHRH